MPIDISVRSFITFYQDETPVDAIPGDVWYKPSAGRFYVRHADGWREASEITRVWPYGYVCGGYDGSNNLSTIDRFQFPFDSGTASHVGNLSGSRFSPAANNSSQHGYVCGGYDGSIRFSTIDRFQFPFDSGTASHVGNLSGIRNESSANNSSQYGYVCGGDSSYTEIYSTILRIGFPFDAGETVTVGTLKNGNRRWSTANNSSLHGFICGGGVDSNTYFSYIDRFTFPFDTGVSEVTGNLPFSIAEFGSSSCNSSEYGYTCGGISSSNVLSIVCRFMFPFDSGVAATVGNLPISRQEVVSNNSSQYGYACGGFSAVNISSSTSYIDRIYFPFSSGTASYVGNLSNNKSEIGATDTTDFIQIFV